MPEAKSPDPDQDTLQRPPVLASERAGRCSPVAVDVHGHVLTIGIDRPDKANAFDAAIIGGLARAYTRLADDDELRVGLVYSLAKHFTAGLDLVSLAPALAQGGEGLIPEGDRDPWRLYGPAVTKPVVVAVHGMCLTAGLELVLASDVCIASDDAVFGQVEVSRGIMAFGGATMRLPERIGWGDAMRLLLSGATFDASEAHRFGIAQEVVPRAHVFDRALEIAEQIARQAPLAVQATLAEARRLESEGTAGGADRLREVVIGLLATRDAEEGITALIERREPRFQGA